MKIIHLYDAETGAYQKSTILVPRQEEIRGMVDKTRIETIEGVETVGGYEYKTYKNEVVPYQEEAVTGYKEIYDMPINATEIPLPNSYVFFEDGTWVEKP